MTQSLGTLISHDGNANGNVTGKCMFMLLALFRGYSNTFNLYNVAELSWNRIGRNGVQVETENKENAVMCSCSPQNLKFSHFTFSCCFAEDGE